MSSHSFDTEIATKFGITAALLICHMQYWVSFNKTLGRNFKDGRTWTYQTIDEIAAHFPYLGIDEIRNTLNFLSTGIHKNSKKGKEINPILLKANYNKTKFDKTIWYAFADESTYISNISHDTVNYQIDTGELPNRRCKLPNRRQQTTEPIPHTKTKTKPDKNNTPPTPKKEERVKFGSFVQLTLKEKEELVSKLGEPLVTRLIDEINDYCPNSRPKGYTDYAATIRSWARRREDTSKSTSPPRNETIKDRIRREQIDEYQKINGSFNEGVNIHDFSK